MATYRWIPITEPRSWDIWVTESAGPCDTSHFAAYHEVSQSQSDAYVGGGGEAFLFAYEDEDLRIAIPLLRRPVSRIPRLESMDDCYDATSAYGYPGILTNRREPLVAANISPSQNTQNTQNLSNLSELADSQNIISSQCMTSSQNIQKTVSSQIASNSQNTLAVSESADARRLMEQRSRFQRTLLTAARELRIVSFFGRGNPLIPGESFWYDGIADVRRTGRTVAIDLTLSRSDPDQYHQIRRDTRARLRQAYDAGVTVRRSIPGANGEITPDDLTLFIQLYESTMRSVGAAPGYYFERSYYEDLFRRLGPDRSTLLIAEYGDTPIASAIFLLSGTSGSVPPGAAIIQYHLSGSVTDERTRRFGGGTRPILDTMRRWGVANGYQWLHMGGGVGGRGPGDSLFDFKAGFSKRFFDFFTVRLIADEERYKTFVEMRQSPESDFFPRYRRGF